MSHDDFAFEPVRGLPERPPADESILWQGRPSAWALACEALSLPWVAGYFALLALWRFGVLWPEGPGAALAGASPYLVLGIVACALLWAVAFVQARSTVYTITDARVAMRIGAALTLTLNLPFRQVARADLSLGRHGTGTVALTTLGESPLSYLHCWPHVRPWRMRPVQPALRCIPDAARVAAILAEAADARVTVPQVTRAAAPAAIAAE